MLLAGLSGCGSEVAKNLMLAGLKSLTLLDNQTVSAYLPFAVCFDDELVLAYLHSRDRS